jgi:IS5 family transposase
MKKSLKTQRTWLGRVVRDIARKASALTQTLKHELEMAKRLISQKPKDKNKLYSLHAKQGRVNLLGKLLYKCG